MKVIIAGGGTGGHIFPGIAIAEEIKRRDSQSEIIFVGTEHGIEASLIPQEGYPIKYLSAEGIVGKSVLKKAKAVMKMLLSVYEAYKLLRDIRPDALIGVGGYASFSPVLAAYLMSIPTIIMEQNTVPGLANKLLGRIVNAVCLTYHESLSSFPSYKTFVTGNPIRMSILTGNRETAYHLFGLERGKFTIFVFGGSAGARAINNAVCDAFNYMSDLKDKIQFLHQTGSSGYETAREIYRKCGFKGTVAAFIHEMPEAYAVADLVISRAGATTITEMTSVGRPAVLIPYPYAAGNHQEANARRLTEMGAARLILEQDLNGDTLSKNIRDLFAGNSLRADMQRANKSLGRPDAAQKVVDILFSLLKARKFKSPEIRMRNAVKNV